MKSAAAMTLPLLLLLALATSPVLCRQADVNDGAALLRPDAEPNQKAAAEPFGPGLFKLSGLDDAAALAGRTALKAETDDGGDDHRAGPKKDDGDDDHRAGPKKDDGDDDYSAKHHVATLASSKDDGDDDHRAGPKKDDGDDDHRAGPKKDDGDDDYSAKHHVAALASSKDDDDDDHRAGPKKEDGDDDHRAGPKKDDGEDDHSAGPKKDHGDDDYGIGGHGHFDMFKLPSLRDEMADLEGLNAHGDAQGGPGDHHKNDPAASIMAVLLLGFVAFDMCLLYMLNFEDPQVQCYSYKMVCQCISIFCALLIQISVAKVVQKGIVMNVMQLFSQQEVESSKLLHESIALVAFFAWFMLISWASFKAHGNAEDTHAVKGIVADVAAFAAIDLFGYGQVAIGEALMATPGNYGKTLLLYIFWPVLVFSVYALFGVGSFFLRRGLLKRQQQTQAALPDHGHAHGHVTSGGHGEHGAHGEHGHHEPEWVEVAAECEMESAAVVIAFMLRQLVLLACQGKVPTMGGYIKNSAGAEAMELFVVVLLLVQMGVSYLSSYLEGANVHQGHHHHGPVAKVLEFLQSLAGFALAWCVLSLVLYIIKTNVAFPTNQKVLVAAAISPFTAVFTIALDKLADHGIMRESFAVKLVACIGLTTGLAWEKAFASSIDSVVQDDIIGVGLIASKLSSNPASQAALAECIVYFSMLAVILPGWKWYIVPPAAKPVPERHLPDEEVATVDKLA